MAPLPRLQHCEHVHFSESVMKEFYACMMKRPWWKERQLGDPAARLRAERAAAAPQHPQAGQQPARSYPEWEVLFDFPAHILKHFAGSATLDGVAMHLRMYPPGAQKRRQSLAEADAGREALRKALDKATTPDDRTALRRDARVAEYERVWGEMARAFDAAGPDTPWAAILRQAAEHWVTNGLDWKWLAEEHGVRLFGVDPGCTQLIHCFGNCGFNGQCGQHQQHVAASGKVAADRAAKRAAAGDPAPDPHQPEGVAWQGHGAFKKHEKVQHSYFVGGKEYFNAAGFLAHAAWRKRMAPALRRANAAARALPACRTLDLAALKTHAACVAGWMRDHGAAVYCSKADRRWSFSKRGLKRRQFDRMAQQLAWGFTSVRGSRDRGVDRKALRAKFRELRSKVKACAVFFGDSGAGHGTVVRRSFRGPVKGFRQWLELQGGAYNVHVVPIDEYLTSQVCSGCWKRGLVKHCFHASRGPQHKQLRCQSSDKLLVVDRDTSGAVCILCKGLCTLFRRAKGGKVLQQAFNGVGVSAHSAPCE